MRVADQQPSALIAAKSVLRAAGPLPTLRPHSTGACSLTSVLDAVRWGRVEQQRDAGGRKDLRCRIRASRGTAGMVVPLAEGHKILRVLAVRGEATGER